MKIKRHSQLYSVERSQAPVNRIGPQKPRCRLKVLLFDWRPDNDSISSDIGSKTT